MYADADDGSLYNMDNPAVFRRFKKSASAACFHAAFFASVMNDSFVRLQLPCWDAPYFQADDSQKDQFAVGAGRGVPPNADPRPDPNPLILCSPSNFKAIRHVGTMTIDDTRDAAILAQGGPIYVFDDDPMVIADDPMVITDDDDDDDGIVFLPSPTNPDVIDNDIIITHVVNP